jgi:hypothetical protein
LRRRFFYKFRPLPDHLGAAAKSLGDSQAQCLCGVQIDDELTLFRPLDRDVGRLCAAQDFVDNVCRAAKQVEPMVTGLSQP